MNIPGLHNTQIVDENGRLTESWYQLLDELFQELEVKVGSRGFELPSLSTADINEILNVIKNGTLIYDSTLNELKIKKNGVIEIIPTIPI